MLNKNIEELTKENLDEFIKDYISHNGFKVDKRKLRSDLFSLIINKKLTPFIISELKANFVFDLKLSLQEFKEIVNRARVLSELGFECETVSDLVEGYFEKTNSQVDLEDTIKNENGLSNKDILLAELEDINQKYFSGKFKQTAINNKVDLVIKNIQHERYKEIYEKIKFFDEDESSVSYVNDLFSDKEEIDNNEDSWKKLIDILIRKDASEDLRKMCEVTLKQFIFMVKRGALTAITGRTHNTIYPVIPLIDNAKNGTGKTSFIEQFLSPLEESKCAVTMNELTDERYYFKFGKYLAGYSDEISKMNKSDLETFKTIVTESNIEYRPLYKNSRVKLNKTISFIGTTNDWKTIKRDTTGGRRWFVIPGSDMIDLKALKNIDMNKIWRSVDENSIEPLHLEGEEFMKKYNEYQTKNFKQDTHFEMFIKDCIENGDDRAFNEWMNRNKLFKSFFNRFQQDSSNVPFPITKNDFYDQIEKLIAVFSNENLIERREQNNTVQYKINIDKSQLMNSEYHERIEEIKTYGNSVVNF